MTERRIECEVGILRWFRRDRTVYRCGNCQLTFKSRASLEAHKDEHGVCPQVTWERKNEEHNTAMRLQFFLDEVLPDE